MLHRLVPKPAGLEEVIRGAAASPALDDCAVIRSSFFRRSYACGHRGSRRFAFSIWGFEVRLTDEFLRLNDECPVCLLTKWHSRIIRCADCGEPILPGTPIATPCRDYRDTDDGRLTVVPHEGGELVVTCLCDDNALGFSGHWDGERIRRLRWTTVPEK